MVSMLLNCQCAISTGMKRWLSIMVGLQCLLLLGYLFFTHNPTAERNVKQDPIKLRPDHHQILRNRTERHSMNAQSFLPRTKIPMSHVAALLRHNDRNQKGDNALLRHKSLEPRPRAHYNAANNASLHNADKHSTTLSPQIIPKKSPSVKLKYHIPQQTKNRSVLSSIHSHSLKHGHVDHTENGGESIVWKASPRAPASPWPPRGMSKASMYKKHAARISNQFSNYDLSHPQSLILAREASNEYTFRGSSNTTCLFHGAHRSNSTTRCNCRPGWSGQHCSIPDSVSTSFSYKYSYSRPELIASPSSPRRVINGFCFNMEWDMLETRMNELGLLVDLFVIIESNYSMYGDPKPLRLLNKLKRGYLKEFHHKIMYVFLDHFPDGGKEDGWLAERYQRNFMSRQCLQRLKGSSPSDLFMFNDADEVPSFESVLFLKMHTGYAEPVGFYLAWSVYGFYWKNNNPTTVISVCSLKFLSDVLQGSVQSLRTSEYQTKYIETLDMYKRNNSRSTGNSGTNNVHEWYIGDSGRWAGWHCSWCLPSEDIRTKLISAINADFPRWGDYPSKHELPYIRNLIQTGMWFDDESKIDNFVKFTNDTGFAPTYLLTHYDRFRSILDLKYAV